MRRYTSLLLTAFSLFVMVLVGSAYLAGADCTEDTEALQEVTVYTTLPAEHAALLANEYEQLYHVKINFVPLAQEDILLRLREQKSNEKEDAAALLLADQETLERAAQEEMLLSYVSQSSDAVPDAFKQADGYWTGVWYDPTVFCVNKDYLRTLQQIPDSWMSLAEMNSVRIGITDFVAADASSGLLFSMIEQYGDQVTYQIWRQIHPKVVQYTKYLNNPVRQAGMGETDISIAVQSEVLRYLNDGYPLKIIYPADGTSYLLTGSALTVGATEQQSALARSLADWLLMDDVQMALQRNNFYFVPTNPETLAYKMFAGKNIVLFDHLPKFTKQQKHDFLDRWVKYIRLK